jgi:hypothetical protein
MDYDDLKETGSEVVDWIPLAEYYHLGHNVV